MADASTSVEKSSQGSPAIEAKRVRVLDAPAANANAGTGSAKENSKTRRSLLDLLPIWVSKNLRSKRSLKVLFRCWLVSWVAVILLLPNKSLQTLGSTAFFALITTLLFPPSVPVQLYILVITTIFLGMLFGWGVSSAAMRASLASRNKVLLAKAVEKVQSSAAGRANPEALFELSIFQGDFLDIRSSAVFGCFLGLGTFIFALMRAYVPTLILASVFGTIAIDIMCAYGPLFPVPDYTILNSLLESAACAAAISIVAIILIFPESISHAYLAANTGMLAGLEGLSRMQNEVFDVGVEVAEGEALLERMHLARIAVQAVSGSIKPLAGFLNLEFSYGRWNGDDVKVIGDHLLILIVRIGGFQSSARMITHRSSRLSTPVASEPASERASLAEKPNTHSAAGSAADVTSDGYLLRQLYARNATAEAAHGVRVADVLPVVERATRELRAANLAALGAARRTIEDANTNRYLAWYTWRGKPQPDASQGSTLVEAISQLRAARDAFAAEGRLALLEPYAALLGPDGSVPEPSTPDTPGDKDAAPLPLRTLIIAYSFASNLLVAAEALLAFLEMLEATTQRRTHARLWAPKGLRAIGKVLMSHQNAVDPGLGEDPIAADAAEVELAEQAGVAVEDNADGLLPNHQSYRLDPDSSPPTNFLQKVASGIHALFRWSTTDEAIFVFKYVLVSIVLWIPAVCKTSANFYYVERGVWTLIMGQTSMNVYAADQLLNYAGRLVFTVIGLVFGLLAWYIGCGNGNGNPYGLAASSAVLLVPLVFFRLFAPPRYTGAVAIGGPTFALVVGYTWIDGHLPTISPPGIGWPVAWKRFLTVVVGIAASFIVMMFPAKSGRKAVRLRNAGTIAALADLYAGLISLWVSTEVPAKKTESEDGAAVLAAKYQPSTRSRIVAVATQLQDMREATAIAQWEGSLRGKWAFSDYNRLIDVQFTILANIALLGNALGHVSPEWRIASLHKTRVVNPDFITEVMSIFSHVSQALRTGHPLSGVLPESLLDRLFYHSRTSHHRHHHRHGGSVATSTQFNLEHLRSLDYVHYSTAIMAVSQIAESVDELHVITKRLCGEVPMRGFDQWREDYDRSHILA